MTKAELKTGMIVEYRSGIRRTVFKNTVFGDDYLCGDGYFNSLKNFTEDLRFEKDSYMDIVKVFSPKYRVDIASKKPPEVILLWTRPEKKKYTYAQIKEILGEEFEIVKE